MYHYERSYSTSRAVSSAVEFAGWAAVVIGVIVALAGFSTGGMAGSLMRGSSGDVPFILRLIGALPGLALALFGLGAVLFAQTSRANLDIAEMTRDMLAIARNSAKGSGMTSSANKSPEHAGRTHGVETGNLVKKLYGYEIVRDDDGVSVDGRKFENVVLAEHYILDTRSKSGG